jgi:predicted secreted Zn-dependent protease
MEWNGIASASTGKKVPNDDRCKRSKRQQPNRRLRCRLNHRQQRNHQQWQMREQKQITFILF